jgi:7-cyano-7-deazaguanine synthase
VIDNHGGPARTVVLLSGGIDSSALLALLARRGRRVSALFVDYGQPAARREWDAARQVARRLGIEVTRADSSGLAITDAGEIAGRNGLFLLTALAVTRISNGVVAIGIHGGTEYSDCGDAFVAAMQSVFDIYRDGTVRVAAPFVSFGKADVWRLATEIGTPLDCTYSCELGLDQPCGRCLSCGDVERLHAGS